MTSAVARPLQIRDEVQVYNPWQDHTFEPSWGGEVYTFPPGVSTLRSKTRNWLNEKDWSGMVPLDNLLDIFFGAVSVTEAERGRSGKLGQYGLRVLTGDPDLDAEIKAEADEVAGAVKYTNCVRLKGQHMRDVAAAKEAGLALPVPNRKVQEAMLYVAEYDSRGPNPNRYRCELCQWGFAAVEDLDAHVAKIHPEAQVMEARTADVRMPQAAQSQVWHSGSRRPMRDRRVPPEPTQPTPQESVQPPTQE